MDEEKARSKSASSAKKYGGSPQDSAAVVPEMSEAARKERNRKIFDLKKAMQSLERPLNKYGNKKGELEAKLATSNDPKLKEDHLALADKVAKIEAHSGWHCKWNWKGRKRCLTAECTAHIENG